MNKTRKEIIELISDYMNQELSEGCLYRHRNSKSEEGVVTRKIKYIDKDGYVCLYRQKSGLLNETIIANHQLNSLSVVGHYEISAVLKYIDKVFGLYLLSGGNHIQVIGTNDRCVGFIPQKPLHLYTEEEEKDLLKLLKELGLKKT